MYCKNCDYCKDHRRLGNTRGSFFCDHPDQEYIYDYFERHKIRKMPGFIGFGKRFETHPDISKSPAWCPLKARNNDD